MEIYAKNECCKSIGVTDSIDDTQGDDHPDERRDEPGGDWYLAYRGDPKYIIEEAVADAKNTTCGWSHKRRTALAVLREVFGVNPCANCDYTTDIRDDLCGSCAEEAEEAEEKREASKQCPPSPQGEGLSLLRHRRGAVNPAPGRGKNRRRKWKI